MFVPSTFAVALMMTIFSTICRRSFANTFKGTKNYRFELYYWDYAIGIFLILLVFAFTMGSYAGGSTAFLANLRSADGINRVPRSEREGEGLSGGHVCLLHLGSNSDRIGQKSRGRADVLRTHLMPHDVLVMGSFVADLAFRADRLPGWGETLMGHKFAVGPGGKGSNQAVAAARAGAKVRFFSKLGDDAFGKMARDIWRESGIDDSLTCTCDEATGAAAIMIDATRGENAIIIVPGACFTLTPDEIDAAADAIRSAGVFLTQLELPTDTVRRGLEIACAAGVTTILNPAPAPGSPLPDELIALSDYLVPNETEAALLTGMPVESIDQAEKAADSLIGRGAKNVIVTLGGRGSLLRTRDGMTRPIPVVNAGPVVETTGAGDAFCGGFAAALAEGLGAPEAAIFASACAGISVTRPGTAPSMPRRAEIETALRGVR